MGEVLLDNLIHLDELSEDVILSQIKGRYNKKVIYTYVGNILVTVNPYQKLPIYDENSMKSYKGKGMEASLPPHIFALSDEAYNNMRSPRMQVGGTGNQVIVISGESGAGKTESSKLIFQYLAYLSEKNSQEITEKILMANPVLEAFGNAKTVRNDNSSRFGKFVKVQYNQKGDVIGSKIEIFLLEKSRITSLAVAEMNYHIFYSLLASAPDQMKKNFSLGKPEEYHYLNQSNLVSTQFYESLNYPNLREAMLLLGFTQTRLESIFKIVASILHLGNIDFAEKEVQGQEHKELYVKNPAELEIVSNLLKVDKDKLQDVMTFRTIKKIKSPNTIEKATAIRDAISKAMYSHMFRFLVDTINATNSCESEHSFIGVLDIFGFENFKVNSLEQLCINLANERLQQYFNNKIFLIEQEIYAQEGIVWNSIEFSSNQDCLDLIEKTKADKERPLGLLQILDDECKLLNSTDTSLLEKFEQLHADKSPKYSKPVHPNGTFSILHYAGKVEYTIAGFLDKNQDSVSQDVIMVFHEDCGDQFVKDLFSKDQLDLVSSLKSGSKRYANLSVSSKFRNSLNELMDTLNSSNPLFIRCIKPNVVKSAAMFTPKVVLEQLRYTGMLETVRIRRSGYSKRIPFSFFCQRYSKLSDDKKRNPSMSERDTCESILLNVFPKGNPSVWQVGNTKVFIRDEYFHEIEKATIQLNAKIVFRAIRLFYYRNRFIAARKAVRIIQKNYRIHLAQKEAKATKDSLLLLNKAILIHLAKKKFANMKEEANKQRNEAIETLQTAIKLHLAHKKIENLRKIKSAKLLLEEQHRIRQENKNLEAAAMRIKVKERIESLKNQGSETHSNPHMTPFMASIHAKNFENQSNHETFGNFSIDVTKSGNFVLTDYSNEYFINGHQFKWQKEPITKSLTDVESQEDAKESFLNILFLMGDMAKRGWSYKESVDSLVNLGLRNPEARTEIFCQIVSQMVDNPTKESLEKGFQLLLICCTCFLPDENFIDYLIAFLKRLSNGKTKSLANLTFERLKWACHSRHNLRSFPPPIEELNLIKESLQLNHETFNLKVPLSIYSVLGKMETFEIDFSHQGRSLDLIDLISQKFLVPKKYKYEFGLFVQFPHEEIMVEDTDYILDILSISCTKSFASGKEFCFIYKRRSWVYIQSEDFSNTEILKYSLSQIEYNFVNSYLPLPNQEMDMTIALAFKYNFGERGTENLKLFLKNFVPTDKRAAEIESIHPRVSKILKDMDSMNKTQAVVSFINHISQSPFFGYWFCKAKIGNSNQAIIAVNSNQVLFISPKTKQKLLEIKLSDIEDIQETGDNSVILVAQHKNKKQKMQIQGPQVLQLEKMIRMYAIFKMKQEKAI